MTIPRYARLAAKLLQRARESPSRPAPPSAAVRDDSVAAMESALVLRGRRQRLRRTMYAGLSVAAAVGVAWFASRPLQSAPDSNRASDANVTDSASVSVHSFGSGARV